MFTIAFEAIKGLFKGNFFAALGLFLLGALVGFTSGATYMYIHDARSQKIEQLESELKAASDALNVQRSLANNIVEQNKKLEADRKSLGEKIATYEEQIKKTGALRCLVPDELLQHLQPPAR